jgi:hypothetical protein
MVSQTDSCGQVYFKRQNDLAFSGERYLSLPIVADGSENFLTVDMSSHPLWTGNIIQLRLDPACSAVNEHTVRIDQVSLTATAMLPFEHQIYLPVVCR